MENITDNQMKELESLRDRVPNLEVKWSDERGVASLLEGSLLSWEEIRTPEEIMPQVIERFGILLGSEEIAAQYKITEIRKGWKGQGFRARAYQAYDDLPIYGATLLVFADEERGVTRIQSGFWRDVHVTAEQEIDERQLQQHLLERLREDKEANAFEDMWREQQPDTWALDHFPLTSRPTLYLYNLPEEGFHPVFDTLAYQPTTWFGVDGSKQDEIGQVQLLIDASNWKFISEASTKFGMAYTNKNGDGLSTLEDSGGNNITRALHVVQKDTADYYLLNRLHTPEIRTYDANGTETGLDNKLKADTDLSKDADNHWNGTTSSCTANDRRDSQQPEVDCHANAEEAWNFYHNFSWDGFDNGKYGTHCNVSTAAHIGMDANAYFSYYIVTTGTNNKYYGYLAFYDGECDGATLKFDFMAGDPIIFGHEYQHAVTFFGAAKPNGEPGLIGASGWPRSLHEGYSDAFGCLRTGKWINPDFFPNGATHKPATSNGPYQNTACGVTATNYCLPFRRIEYPRSTDTHRGDWYLDHYDDRDQTQTTQCFSRDYFRSTLLSHLAFLVGQGGIHQRASRGDAELIPVLSIGLQRTAEILLYALTQYFDNLPTNKQGETMIKAGQYILDAAKDIPGGSDRTCEYVMIRRALFALGLYPYDGSYNKQTYGGEACMLPWTYAWRFSRPYLGFPALWWKSPDLFINNNGTAEYNAVVGQENKVFARVRNIGDQNLSNVQVKFYFCPMGTNLPASIAGWHPCKNQLGTNCVLNIATLAASSMNFTNVNTPPASQAVHWYLDPAYVTADVDHFCLRAVIECEAANHNNDCPNQVQSNVQHTEITDDDGFGIKFQVANWGDEPSPLDLFIDHSLPRGYHLEYVGEQPLKEIVLYPNEPKTLKFRLMRPRWKPAKLVPPFDGKVSGKLEGEISGYFLGQLISSRVVKTLRIERLLKRNILISGKLAGKLGKEEDEASLNDADFTGQLDPVTGEISGKVIGSLSTRDGRYFTKMTFKLTGCLDPLRAVNFTQLIDGEAVGGITVNIKFPKLARQCTIKD